MRAFVGLVLLATCACAAVVVSTPIWSWKPSGFVSSLLLVAGFATLGLMRTPTAPLRPVRATARRCWSIANACVHTRGVIWRGVHRGDLACTHLAAYRLPADACFLTSVAAVKGMEVRGVTAPRAPFTAN